MPKLWACLVRMNLKTSENHGCSSYTMMGLRVRPHRRQGHEQCGWYALHREDK